MPSASSRRRGSWPLAALCLTALIAFAPALRAQPAPPDAVRHVPVYYEPGRFAGWPANLGIWSWGDEILVGFVEAAHLDEGGFHTYDQDTARDKFARSRDGGQTWSVEDAYAHGQTAWRYNNRLPQPVGEPAPLRQAIDFDHPDLALTFQRRTNHIGPSHFYYSYDRGRQWQGPFALPNFDTPGIATRTDYLVDGPRTLTAFFTVGKRNEREGRVMAARTDDGGLTWRPLAYLGPEPERFEIMPASVRLSPTEILTVVRHRGADERSRLVSYRSTDDGHTWARGVDPVADTGEGGTPAALVQLQDGSLALAYVIRSNRGSRLAAKRSRDGGRTWGEEVVLRADGATKDAGYPRMVQRPDGTLVVVYYWNTALRTPEAPWRFIGATLFDPAVFETAR